MPSASTHRSGKQRVRVGDLEVDRTPVTNARYAAFVEFTGHRPPAYWPNGECPKSLHDHPVVGVDYFDAVAYALWAGGRLPTEMEWVLASGLEEPRAYVWGDQFDKSLCNTVRSEIKGTTPVGSYPPAPSGCVDLIGNVWEMTCSAYPGDDEAVIVKGGSWYDFPGHAKLDTQFSACVQKHGNTIGFRLVYGGATRLPDFLTKDLVAQCIAFRKQGAEAKAKQAADNDTDEPNDDANEFLAVVSKLRDEAQTVMPELQAASPDVDVQAVDDALDTFDLNAYEPFADWPADEAPAPEYKPDLMERAQHALARRPRTWLGVACGLAVLLLWWTISSQTDSARGSRTVASTNQNGPARHGVTPARVDGGDTTTGSDRNTNDGNAPRRGLDRALHALRTGTPEQREEAELYLLQDPKRARERVKRALQDDLPEAGQASLRYVLATLREQEPGRAPTPRVVMTPPREGLVVFFDAVDADSEAEIARVRRTALAEGLPVTAVYVGDENGQHLARVHRDTLRGVRLYVDRERTLAGLWGASRLPSVAGVRRGGRLAFLHIGSIRRSALAEKVAELADR